MKKIKFNFASSYIVESIQVLQRSLTSTFIKQIFRTFNFVNFTEHFKTLSEIIETEL